MKKSDIDKLERYELLFERLVPELRKEYPKMDAERLAKVTVTFLRHSNVKEEEFPVMLNKLCWAMFE